MLRPLLTHFWLYTALLLANFANGQSVVAESNAGICNCVGSDQFVSTIKLNSLSANESGWIIQNFVNVYQPTVLAPSAPVAITGMMNVSTDANMCHTFTFMHQVGEIFSFQITNGTTTFQVPGNLPFAGCTYTPVPLACNNNVNVSVDQFCEAEITPDIFLLG